MKKDPMAAKALEEQLMKLAKDNPILGIVGGLVLFKICVEATTRPAWLKDLAPIGGRVAGPWRGKGSFGHGFGSQVKHR